MSNTILLTGGAGFIGSHVYVELVAAGYDVVVIDNFSNSDPSVIERLADLTQKPVEFRQIDILDKHALSALFDEFEFAAAIHFAALKAVGESVEDPLSYFETNISGLINLLQVMSQHNVTRLVYSSSATVYGEPDTLPIPETAPLSYTNPYGFTKLVGEQILEQLCASHPDWAVGVLRYFNPAGAHPSAKIGEDPKGIPNNLVPYITKVAEGTLPHLRVFGTDYDTPDGTGIRDYIHVCDLAHGHVLSLQALERDGRGHVVNLGTGKGVSVQEMLDAYGRATNQPIPAQYVDRRTGDVAACYSDATKAQEVLGFRATRSVEDICASAWAWSRKA